MIRRLGTASTLLVFFACSSTSAPKPNPGDAATDVAALEAGFPDTSTPDAPSAEAQPDGAALDGKLPDASQPDANTPDANTPDAPAVEVLPDASTPDAPSVEAQPDGAVLDAPAENGGSLSCDEYVHDPVLGTAKLGDAFRVVDSATLPVTSWLPVVLVDEALVGGSTGQVVYGYAGDGRVHRLGVWPVLAAPDATNVAFDAVSPADRSYQIVTTPLLVTARGQVLAGYRTLRSAAFVGGGISVYDTARPAAGARWMAATGVEGALGIGSYFLVGGDSLESAAGGRGVYGVYADDPPQPLPGLVAKYPVLAEENVRPGPMAVTSNGLVVMGYYLDRADRHSLRLPEPSQIAEALSGGAAIDLAAARELTQASDAANVVSLGQGVAVLHTRKVRGILPALGRLDHYELSRSGGDAGTTVGAPVTMLSSTDSEACTAVSQLVPVAGGMTVIVGLWDRNGQRLVRLAPR